MLESASRAIRPAQLRITGSPPWRRAGLGGGVTDCVGRREWHAPGLQLHRTKLGSILVDHNGYTVYTFSTDKRNYDSCVAIPQCLARGRP